MTLERGHDLEQLVVGLLVDRLEVGERDGVADARDDVLALRVLQVVAVDALRAAGRVAGERDAGAGVHVEVAEHHRDDVDGGAEVGRDAFLPAVEHRAVAVPGLEDRLDGEVHLLAGVLRELAAGVLDHDLLVGVDQLAQVVGVEVEVVGRALRRLRGLECVVEVLAVDAHDGLAEHRQQPAVGVEREPLVAAAGRETAHGLVVEADVEDGVHHPGHRELGAGAHRHQQRVVGLTQLLAHRALERREVLVDLGGEVRRGCGRTSGRPGTPRW